MLSRRIIFEIKLSWPGKIKKSPVRETPKKQKIVLIIIFAEIVLLDRRPTGKRRLNMYTGNGLVGQF